MMAATPASSKRFASSSAVSSEVSAQPCVATLPSRASSPTATRLGNLPAASFTRAGPRTAGVRRMTRATPLSSQPSIVAMSRMPPPSCTHRPTVSRMRSIAPALRGLPAKAPSRSTTCRWRKPSDSNSCACAAGSRLNTVARAMSPCSRRTQTPSLRSIAGNRIIFRSLRVGACPYRRTGIHPRSARGQAFAWTCLWRSLEKIRDQRKTEALALFGMELRAHHGVARHDRGERATIVGLRDEVGAVCDFELIRVHEIGMLALRAGRDTVEHRMVAQLGERVPAHVRDLEMGIGRRDAVDLAGDPAEPRRHLVLAAALAHQLHADADAEERPALLAHRDVERLDHAADRVEPAPAIGERANPRQHDAIGA